jgi:hypothetical protein
MCSGCYDYEAGYTPQFPGAELEADLIVTATGLNLKVLGGLELVVDGERIEPARTLAYKGMMYSGVLNFASATGYTNASWTLKSDLTCEYVCRLLNFMKTARPSPVHRPKHRPDGHRGAVARLHVGIRAALGAPVPEAGLEGALEAAPELRARHHGAALRACGRRRDGVFRAVAPAPWVAKRIRWAFRPEPLVSSAERYRRRSTIGGAWETGHVLDATLL